MLNIRDDYKNTEGYVINNNDTITNNDTKNDDVNNDNFNADDRGQDADDGGDEGNDGDDDDDNDQDSGVKGELHSLLERAARSHNEKVVPPVRVGSISSAYRKGQPRPREALFVRPPRQSLTWGIAEETEDVLGVNV